MSVTRNVTDTIPGGRESPAETVRLSTGETVALPIETEGVFYGAVFPAPRPRVASMLPDGLTPIRATPGRAAVTLMSLEYTCIADGEITPYNEFAVALPAVHDTRSIPYVSVLSRGLGGYMWYLPVTSELGVTLGVDIWGYPKDLADITHTDDGSRRRTRVTVEGDHFLTLVVDRPPTFPHQDTGYAYGAKDGRPLYVPNEVSGEVGGWPFSSAVLVEFGDHPRADQLRDLALGDRALLRFFVDGEVVYHAGERIGTAA